MRKSNAPHYAELKGLITTDLKKKYPDSQDALEMLARVAHARRRAEAEKTILAAPYRKELDEIYSDYREIDDEADKLMKGFYEVVIASLPSTLTNFTTDGGARVRVATEIVKTDYDLKKVPLTQLLEHFTEAEIKRALGRALKKGVKVRNVKTEVAKVLKFPK